MEPLNAAIEEIRNWTQPTIFLTGNHDQVRSFFWVFGFLGFWVFFFGVFNPQKNKKKKKLGFLICKGEEWGSMVD